MFFGRTEMLNTIVSRVTAGQNTGVFGLRRIGRTSILYAVKRRCGASKTAYAFYKDMSPTFRMRWWEVLQLLVNETAHTLSLPSSGRKRLAANQDSYTERNGAAKFGADIEYLAARVPHGRLVLLLDEIENISFDVSPATHWNEDFLGSEARVRAGLPNVRIHDLRHTAATNMLSAGADVLSVARVLGHSTPVLTLSLYGHVLDAGVFDAVSRETDRGPRRAPASTTRKPRLTCGFGWWG